MQLDAVIIGAGPAGLAVAHEMHRAGACVKIIEPSNRVGGSIRTISEEGWLVETGPNTLQTESDEDVKLLESYGLKSSMLLAERESAKRYILSRGKLHGLTSSPTSLFTSNLLSFTEKLRLLAEFFIPGQTIKEETVQHFMERRFGRGVANLLVDPFISGIHAGDPQRLVLQSCFPILSELEKKHASVLFGLMLRKKSPRRIIGFKGGMQELANALAQPLRAESLECGAILSLIQRDQKGWQVAWRNTSGQENGAWTKKIVVTAPHWQWNSLPFDLKLKNTLREWESAESAPVTVVAQGYRRSDIQHPLDGFGFLVPHQENRSLLGCLFPSAIFPHRAPEGKVLLCSFVGGSRRPNLAHLIDNELRHHLRRELSSTLGIQHEPEKEWIQRWDRAIPQYVVGQSRREEALTRAEENNPGLHFHGAFRGGISLMQVIRQGHQLGQELLSY